MEIRNLTPHVVTVVGGNGKVVATFPPSGVVARVATTSKKVENLDGIEVFETAFGEIVDLPEPTPSIRLVVSGLVRTAAAGRTDLLSPGQLVRDKENRVIGCRGFNR